jgi:hypothetical protein
LVSERKKLSLREIREELARKKGLVQNSKVRGFKKAVARAGFNEIQFNILMEAYKELLSKFSLVPLEKLNTLFLISNLPSANVQMKSIPNSVIVAFANFATNNRTRFSELRRKVKRVAKSKK